MKMKMVSMLGGLALLAGCATGGGHGDGGHGMIHWGYSGETGPENWANLHASHASCNGVNQSPINLTDFTEADLPPIEFHYPSSATEILNNGHTVQVNMAPGSSILVDGRHFELKQFHFHAPSENQIMGANYPLEAHLVHADAEGNLAVVAVMFRYGDEHGHLGALWANMPTEAGVHNSLHANMLGAEAMLPGNRDYYRFSGSLTTPPCTEGVIWLVMKEAVEMSVDQSLTFTQVHLGNNRPIQPTNARLVLQ